jgi:Ca-activated chloride channel family protein
VILLSDGKRTERSDPLAAAQRAKQLGIRISTVALGTADATILAPNGEANPRAAGPGDARAGEPYDRRHFTETADAGKLSSVYKNLGSEVGTKRVKREVSSSFAAGSLVLLLAGLGTGLRRRGRLP